MNSGRRTLEEMWTKLFFIKCDKEIYLIYVSYSKQAFLVENSILGENRTSQFYAGKCHGNIKNVFY